MQLDANGDGISFTEFAAWWCADPKETSLGCARRSAVAACGREKSRSPSRWMLRKRSWLRAQSDPKALETMAALKQDLDTSVRSMAKPAPLSANTALSAEERKKDDKMKRRHQFDVVFAQFDKDGSGDITYTSHSVNKELGQNGRTYKLVR